MPEAGPLLRQHALEAPRRLALRYLTAVDSAKDRLDDPDDAEALHDFRVAVRRLRSCLRAFKPQLQEAVSGRLRRELKAISESSRESRDTEVQLAWLEEQLPGLSQRQRTGAKWLIARLQERKRESDADLRAEVDAFSGVRRRLEKRLSAYTTTVHLDGSRDEPEFSQILARTISRLTHALSGRLAVLCSPDDQSAAHSARIAGKRLRYVLEAIEEEVPGADSLVRELEQLQDVLGDLHDAHVAAATLARSLEEAAAEAAAHLSAAILAGENVTAYSKKEQRRDPRAGLFILAERLLARRNAAYAKVESRWLGEHQGDLQSRLHEVCDHLEATLSPPEVFNYTSSATSVASATLVQSTFPTIPASTAAKVLRRVSDASRDVT